MVCSRGSDNMARELLDVELIKHVLVRKQYQYMQYGLLDIFKHTQGSMYLEHAGSCCTEVFK